MFDYKSTLSITAFNKSLVSSYIVLGSRWFQLLVLQGDDVTFAATER